MFIKQKNHNHTFFMELALKQASKNLGNTQENPSVGCVVVKNNNLISAGYTGINGRPHAEYNALKFSNSIFKDSTLYSTLEPCSNYGKTPPCVNAIIKKKIKNVFFSISDPDLRSFNKSIKKFKKNNINVNIGLLNNKITSFYNSYILQKKSELPFVTCKLAVSKDFFTINKKKEWITNTHSRSRVHLMRSYHDCLITSSKTIINDNPHLTCRIDGLNERSPTRIILDNKLKINLQSNIFNDHSKKKTIIFYNKKNTKKIKKIRSKGIKICFIELDCEGNLDLLKSLKKVKDLGFSRVFLEAGLNLSTNFFKKKLVNEFKIFISNETLKKNGSNNIKYLYHHFLKNKKFTQEKVNLHGEKLLNYRIK
jgi:diaminohydroxyphosphoribosylaminopyrimidine deaminase / 5-amino-6-(5-phosphoribosylamino)uracil reductase